MSAVCFFISVYLHIYYNNSNFYSQKQIFQVYFMSYIAKTYNTESIHKNEYLNCTLTNRL